MTALATRDDLLAALAASDLPANDRRDILGLILCDQLGLARTAFTGCMAVMQAALAWPPTTIERVVTDRDHTVVIHHHGQEFRTDPAVARILPAVLGLAADDPARQAIRDAAERPDLCNRCRDRNACVGDHCSVCRGVLDDLSERAS